ncbi:hypothetical protein, partial [Agrobacterium vitis]
MLVLPQKDFRGKLLSFDEFYDLVIIGMVGLSDGLMTNTQPALSGGMVNYKRVAENLGLVYEPGWIDAVGRALENQGEAIATHDTPPDSEEDDGHWVYLNSGITRIGELLSEKYYSTGDFQLDYDEFRDVLLFELGGMAQDRITEDGRSAAGSELVSYNLATVADHLNLFYEAGWIERIASEWLSDGIVVAAPQGSVSAVSAPLDWVYFEACCVCEKVSSFIWRFAWQMMDLLVATKL